MIVEVEPTAGRPGRYNATCGAVFIGSTRTPLLSMARRLLDLGLDPNTELRMQHRGNEIVAMQVRIGDAAKLTVSENEAHGPRFAKYKPFPGIE